MAKEKKDISGLRYILDFKIIPGLFIQEPGGVLGMCEASKMVEFLAHVFNGMYDGYKTFSESDFQMTKYENNSAFVYYVNMPDEHEGSMVWCNAYGFCFTQTEKGISCQFLTVETSDVGTHALCGIEYDGGHSNYGMAFSNDKKNAEKMLELISPKPQHVYL